MRSFRNVASLALSVGSKSFYSGILIPRSIPYDFTDGDLRICMRQLKIFLSEYDEIPYKVLKYTAGEINYGGRVTDDWDRRLMMTVLEDFYNGKVVEDEYLFSKSLAYKSIPAGTLQDYRDYIRQLPMDEGAEVFSMDNNANITFAQKETFTMLETLLALMPRSVNSSTGKSREDILLESAQNIMEKVAKPFDLDAVMQKYPTDYKESMSTVLVQEIIRYNRLLSSIHETLPEVVRALKGIVVMSEALEKLCNSLFINAVPAMWSAKAYPSLKPLSSWVLDLAARIQFLQTWIDNGIPSVFWISGFFFPQAFLTGTFLKKIWK
jgi:dynein heavy chain